MSIATYAIWAICLVATIGVITRPFKLPEAVWAVAGAALLLLFGLMPVGEAWAAVMKGGDVYLFLIGMMLLSEVARAEGLFDWVAEHAVRLANGSTSRLFALVFGVGIVVTTFLSNDATAVVLTPAVYAAAKKAKADPLPMLFACALIANAASFVLPISNPANLVLYGGEMPTLGAWMMSFALPSLLSIGVTFLVLRWVERERLAGNCETLVETGTLSRGGKIALGGIVATAVVLIVASAEGLDLGLPTCIAGIATMVAICVGGRKSPVETLRSVSWAVLPLVAGLFVLVEALASTGVIAMLALARRQRRRIADDDRRRRGDDPGVRIEPDEQPPRRADREHHAATGARPADRHRRPVDRCRRGAEPVDHRLARHDIVADRDPPRGRERRVLAVPEGRRGCDAARAVRGPRRAHAHRLSAHAGRWRIRCGPQASWRSSHGA